MDSLAWVGGLRVCLGLGCLNKMRVLPIAFLLFLIFLLACCLSYCCSKSASTLVEYLILGCIIYSGRQSIFTSHLSISRLKRTEVKMQFSTTLILAAVAALASAQNPFTFTSLTSIPAGTPFNITWAPSTGTTDTVSLVLRQGESTDLDTVETIACELSQHSHSHFFPKLCWLGHSSRTWKLGLSIFHSCEIQCPARQPQPNLHYLDPILSTAN